jgi:hypothetical protein
MSTSSVGSTETTKINLVNSVTVNGITYPAGQHVEVPKKQADDIARIDYDHQKYLATLHKKDVVEINKGTMSVGGA